MPPNLSRYLTAYDQASSDLSYHFFDATTDIGLPTVYALQEAPFDSRTTTLVACAVAGTIAESLAKVICDMASVRGAFRVDRQIPASWDDFCDMFHGSTLMAKAECMSAFDFLHHTPSSRRLSDYDRRLAPPPTFEALMDLLRDREMDTFVVDLTTDEALRAGIRVVRVIIPSLQPLSFRYRARFLGHSRQHVWCTATNGISVAQRGLSQSLATTVCLGTC